MIFLLEALFFVGGEGMGGGWKGERKRERERERERAGELVSSVSCSCEGIGNGRRFRVIQQRQSFWKEKKS